MPDGPTLPTHHVPAIFFFYHVTYLPQVLLMLSASRIDCTDLRSVKERRELISNPATTHYELTHDFLNTTRQKPNQARGFM